MFFCVCVCLKPDKNKKKVIGILMPVSVIDADAGIFHSRK